VVTKVSPKKVAGLGKASARQAAVKGYRKAVGKASAGAVGSGAKRLKKSPLSKAELDEFRQMLVQKRRDLIGDMSGIESGALRTNRQDGSGDLSNMPTHPADIGSDNFEHEFTLGLLESERALLTEINEALERIDEGTYGICPGTGQPIGVARLRARPWAKYCIEYARLLEKGLVQPGENEEERREGEEPEEEPEEVEEREPGEEEADRESPEEREVEEEIEE
jgi:RNA polymerase-binding protein DksA